MCPIFGCLFLCASVSMLVFSWRLLFILFFFHFTSQQKQRDGRSLQILHVCSFTPTARPQQSYRFSRVCVCVCVCLCVLPAEVCPSDLFVLLNAFCCLSLKQPCREKQSVCHRGPLWRRRVHAFLPPRLAPPASVYICLCLSSSVSLSRAASSITQQTAALPVYISGV